VLHGWDWFPISQKVKTETHNVGNLRHQRKSQSSDAICPGRPDPEPEPAAEVAVATLGSTEPGPGENTAIASPREPCAEVLAIDARLASSSGAQGQIDSSGAQGHASSSGAQRQAGSSGAEVLAADGPLECSSGAQESTGPEPGADNTNSNPTPSTPDSRHPNSMPSSPATRLQDRSGDSAASNSLASSPANQLLGHGRGEVKPLSSLCTDDFPHWDRATLTSAGNAHLFDTAWSSLGVQHREMLHNTQITATDALMVFKHVGAEITMEDISDNSLWDTPGKMFYTPSVYRSWVPENSGKTACEAPECVVLNGEKGYHCTSLTCCKMILADCLRNAVHTSGKHFISWQLVADGKYQKIESPNDGVYYERKESRITCARSYGALKCLDNDVLPRKPGVMVQCIFELHADRDHAHSIRGQRYCLEQHVCVTGLYLNLVPATRLFDKGFGSHYKVCDSFTIDFPRVAAYMQSDAFVSATG